MEAQHRTAVPEEAVLVLAVAADLAAAAGLAGLAVAAGLAAALAVAAVAVAAVVAAVLAVGPTVLIRLVPHESRDPACFLASRS